ncbi:MAG TPA: DUF3037 domain-containing protein [Actinomycetota bacterium]|nr:DUF3037 domain-containing protein [Actinomycetota bacterium]
MTAPGERQAFEYFAVRCVPRIEREEFLNLGVVLFCPAQEFLALATDLPAERLAALAPGLDLAQVQAALDTLDAVCRGDRTAGPVSVQPSRERFGWLAAPRSTVVQPGPVHAGMTADPGAELRHLLTVLVG